MAEAGKVVQGVAEEPILSTRELKDLADFCELGSADHLESCLGECPGCGAEWHTLEPGQLVCASCGKPSDVLMGALFAGGVEIL